MGSRDEKVGRCARLRGVLAGLLMLALTAGALPAQAYAAPEDEPGAVETGIEEGAEGIAAAQDEAPGESDAADLTTIEESAPADSDASNEPALLAQAEDDIASGTCGTCEWVIDADGKLTIKAGTLADNVGGSDKGGPDFWPWYAYRSQVSSVVFETGVVAGSYLDGLFYGFSRVISIDLSGLDTSETHSLNSAFRGCSSLDSLDVSSMDSSHLTNTYRMLSGCSSLTSLDFTRWSGASLYAGAMFSGCSRLTSVAFPNMTITNDASEMFQNCSSLVRLDLSGWDTSNVYATRQMFYGCSDLKMLDLSSWNTSFVDGGDSNMFYGCSSLASLSVGAGYTIQTASMYPDVTVADGKWWSTADKKWYSKDEIVVNRSGIADTYLASTIAIPNDASDSGRCGTCDWYISMGGANLVVGPGTLASNDDATSNFFPWNGSEQASEIRSVVFQPGVIAGESAAYLVRAEGASSVDISGLDISKVTNMHGMFSDCESVASLDVSGWDTSKVTDMGGLFSACFNLASVDVSGWDTANVTDMSEMFGDANSLQSLDVSKWDTSKVTNMTNMFNSCGIDSLDASGWDTSKVTDMTNMFHGCYLTSLDITGWDTSAVTSYDNMYGTTLGHKAQPSSFRVGARYAIKGVDMFPDATAAQGWWSTADKRWYTKDQIVASRSGIADTYLAVAPKRVVSIVSDTWSIANSTSIVGSEGIRQELVSRMFGNNLARVLYSWADKRHKSGFRNIGSCYGLSATAAAISLGDPAVSGLGAQSLAAIRNLDQRSSALGITIRDYIRLGQIAQFDPQMLAERSRNQIKRTRSIGQLSGLVAAVRAWENGGEPVTVLLKGSYGEHAVWALRVAEDTGAATTIAVYDSNRPGVERSLRLLKRNGAYVNWEFAASSGRTWSAAGDDLSEISWATPGNDLSAMMARNGTVSRSFEEGYKSLLLLCGRMTVVGSDGTEYQLESGATPNASKLLEVSMAEDTTGAGSDDGSSLWWANLADEVTFSGAKESTSVSVASPTGGVVADVQAGGKVTTKVADGMDNKVSVAPPKGASQTSFGLTYFGDGIADVTLSGSGKGTVSTAQTGSDVTVKGASTLAVESAAGKTQTTGLSASTTYTVIAKDNNGKPSVVLGNLSSAKVAGISSTYAYTGKQIAVGTSKVTLNGVTVPASLYSVSFAKDGKSISASQVKECGTYQLVVTALDKGAKGYGGKTSVSFKVQGAIAKAVVSGVKASYTYTGKQRKVAPVVRLVKGGAKLKAGTDYTVSFQNAKGKAIAASKVKAVGSYRLVITGKGANAGTKTVGFKIVKAANPIKAKKAKVKAKKAKLVVRYAKLKSAKRTTACNVRLSGYKKATWGKLTYANASTNKTAKKFKVNKATGKVTIPKGTKKGTYTIKIKVKAKGSAGYKAGSKTVKYKIVVK